MRRVSGPSECGYAMGTSLCHDSDGSLLTTCGDDEEWRLEEITATNRRDDGEGGLHGGQMGETRLAMNGIGECR